MKVIEYENMTEEQKKAYYFADEYYKMGAVTLLQVFELFKKYKIITED